MPDSSGPFAAAPAPLPTVLESLPPAPARAVTREQQEGQALYGTLCSRCHGPYGHGDGPAARGFSRAIPDLARLAQAAPLSQLVAHLSASASSATGDVWHAQPAETLRVTVAYLQAMNPTGSRGNAAAGRLLYAAYCVHCHGVSGRGDGRLAAGTVPRPANLRSLRLVGRERDVVASIRDADPRHHRAYMPDWSLVLTEERLWDLVAYLAVYQAPR